MKSIETDITVFKGNFQKILILIDASFKQQTWHTVKLSLFPKMVTHTIIGAIMVAIV